MSAVPDAPQRLVVVSMLGVSVLRGTQWEQSGEPLPEPPPESDWPTALDEVVRRRSRHPTAPSAELTPLQRVWEHLGRAREVELVLVHNAVDPLHRFCVEALRRIAGGMTLASDAALSLTPVDVGEDSFDKTMAPPVQRRVANAVAPYLLAPPDISTAVAVNAAAGYAGPKQTLSGLAAVTGATLFFNSDFTQAKVAFLSLPPVVLDRVETLARLDHVGEVLDIAATLGRLEADRRAEELGVSELVVEQADGTLARSPVAVAYAQAAVDPERSQMLRGYAAGASLLARRGHGDHARRLWRLVHWWLTQRLWALNQVPELVAHDERHVERVDHLVTSLAAPLLRGEALDGAVDADDVLLLSCAAWLHDWGHVGGPLGSGYVTHPLDVRMLHGALTAELIAQYPTMHGLDDLAGRVAVLCAHHQGWTSFGGHQPADKSAYWEEYDYTPKVFDDRAAAVGLNLEKARLLLALLRVADAADVGRHRIPDYAARDDLLYTCTLRTVSRARAEVQKPSKPAEDGQVDSPELREELARFLDALRDRLIRLEDQRPRLSELLNEEAHRLSEGLKATALGARLERYLDLLRETRQHYDKHAAILSVRFQHAGGRVTPMVTPVDPDSRSVKALEAVQKDIGNELDRPGETGGVRETLATAGVIVAPARWDD